VTLRVLLVDDHRLFREGLKGLLTSAGFEVVAEAGNGAEAVALARSQPVDMVLMDLNMPLLDGMRATRLIKADQSGLPIVILTASETDEDLFEAVKSGAAGYLLKSYDPETVLRLVRGAAAGEPALTPQLAAKILDEFARLALSTDGAAGPSTTPAGPPPPAPPDAGPPPSGTVPLPDHVESLSAREQEVLQLLVAGKGTRDIAAALVVSENTVKFHLRNILQKLHLHSRAQVVAFALRYRLADLPPQHEWPPD
jgi:DNA-binding NarL/FixJ family response regulator